MQKECLESSGFWYCIVRYGIAIFRRNISLLSSWYRVQLVVRSSTWLINNKNTARNITINLELAWKPHARCTCVASRSVHLITIRCKLVTTFPPQSIYSPIRVAVIQWILSLPVVEPWLFFRPARSLITVMTGSNYRCNNLLIFLQKIRIYLVVGWLIDWLIDWLMPFLIF